MKYDCIVIGGGASGMAVAAAVRGRTLVIERNERLGKKLSATGNGQGNVTNLNVAEDKYFTSGGKATLLATYLFTVVVTSNTSPIFFIFSTLCPRADSTFLSLR